MCAMLCISSDTQGKLWPSLGPIYWKIVIRRPILSPGVAVQTKLLYEKVHCKPCSTIHMLFILTFTEHFDLLNSLHGSILLVD